MSDQFLLTTVVGASRYTPARRYTQTTGKISLAWRSSSKPLGQEKTLASGRWGKKRRWQVEGGFIQGVGWLTCEEVLFNAKGTLLTHSPDTYKIPAFGDAPVDFRVELLEGAPQEDVVHGSKAVGEPPLMLALSVVAALRQAISAFGQKGIPVELNMPCTPEALLKAIDVMRTR